ncbi:ammonium transporter [Nitrospira sp. Kam-Ns4a]
MVWLLSGATLTLLTIPGVALFYGGMVRKKNVIHAMGLPLAALVLASVMWPIWAAVVSFGLGRAGGGSASGAWLSLPGIYKALAGALALALVSGAVVERIRFSFFLLFGGTWLALVYGPVAQWLWGGGWLAGLGSLDFAGGAVVHITAGVTALVAAFLTGPRRGYGRTEMMPNNLPLSLCGACLMWVGWYGFSSGTGTLPEAVAVTTATGAFVAIQAAAAGSALTWTVAEWLQRDKPTALGTVSGAVAGLVAIAPAAGYVGHFSALVIGVGAGGLGYMAVNFLKPILGYDDALDVFGVHGVGGTWGMIATGLFASAAVNPDGNDGLFFGYPYQFFAQLVATLAVWAYAGLMTGLLFLLCRTVVPPRVDDEAELMGLDLAQHGEKGYT